jgi:hypothetical protein
MEKIHYTANHKINNSINFQNNNNIGKCKYIFYPPSQKAPSGRAGINAKRVSAIALAPVLRSPSSVAGYCGGWTGY